MIETSGAMKWLAAWLGHRFFLVSVGNIEEDEASAKTPSSPTRASSMTNMRLFQMASEVAGGRGLQIVHD
eukprot:s2265_g8.t1